MEKMEMTFSAASARVQAPIQPRSFPWLRNLRPQQQKNGCFAILDHRLDLRCVLTQHGFNLAQSCNYRA